MPCTLSTLLQSEQSYLDEAEQAAGFALICSSYPLSDLVLQARRRCALGALGATCWARWACCALQAQDIPAARRNTTPAAATVPSPTPPLKKTLSLSSADAPGGRAAGPGDGGDAAPAREEVKAQRKEEEGEERKRDAAAGARELPCASAQRRRPLFGAASPASKEETARPLSDMFALTN